MEGQALTSPGREPFAPAFLAGEPRARPFLAADFRRPEDRARGVQTAVRRRVDDRLLAALRRQNAAFQPSPARDAHLAALAGPSTVVVTGQQVGLFLGPLYTFYKAASAVALARLLERETGVRCIPVFWLQTEDHDFPEVATCHSRRADGTPVDIALAHDAPTADVGRCSLAHRLLGPEVSAAVGALEASLTGLPHAEAVMTLFGAHYRPGQRLAGAFANVLATLFAEEGLVLMDPRDADVAALGRGVFSTCLTQAPALEAALAIRSEALAAAGFKVQVPVRPGACLAFFHPQGAGGPRFRLEQAAGGWTAPGLERSLSTGALCETLDADPLRFSTSALLRPVLQDTILPTAAYVGGPGELNYFAELAPLYRAFGLEPTLFALRARFRCVEPPARAALQALGLAPADAELSPEALARKVPRRSTQALPDPAALRQALLSEFERTFSGLAPQLAALDQGLDKALRRTRETVDRGVGRFLRRYERAIHGQDAVTQGRLDRLRAALCPAGVPQERYDGVPHFLARHGIREFKARIFDCLDPVAGTVRDVSL